MKEIMLQEHKGIGGLYFLTTNLICAVIMSLSLQLSWSSQVVAIADNLAYIACINTTVHNYIGHVDSYDEINPSINVIATNSTYRTLDDFNRMINSAGISTSDSARCRVVWDDHSHQTRIQFSSFDTILGQKVKPHEQYSVIEDY